MDHIRRAFRGTGQGAVCGRSGIPRGTCQRRARTSAARIRTEAGGACGVPGNRGKADVGYDDGLSENHQQASTSTFNFSSTRWRTCNAAGQACTGRGS